MTPWADTSGVPRIPLGDGVEAFFEWVETTFGGFFDQLATAIDATVTGFSSVLTAPPPLVMVVVLSLLAWLVRDWRLGLASLVGLTFVIGVAQWAAMMQTLSLVFFATLVSLLIGIPLGIAAARWQRVSQAVRPVMDLMQTMPAFVWIVPAVTLYGIGVPAGLVATVIFALPPAVRLTELGIRQVDAEVVEAGHAFGATPRQILRETQLPLAMPTVMAGVNQVIMLALSMAVIAGLVGGGGLGSQVTTSISQLDIGLGFEAGLSVVVLAVYLDRLTAALGRARQRRRSGLRAAFGRLRGRGRGATGSTGSAGSTQSGLGVAASR